MSLICFQCTRQARGVCCGCHGAMYCSTRCQIDHRKKHAEDVKGCKGTDDFPSIKTPVVSRRGILAKFNTFTESSVQFGVRMLLYAEASVTKVKVVFGNAEPCARLDRACTDGETIWISGKMNKIPPTLAEMGIVTPKWVEPWSIVILHECAHVIMRHSDPRVRESYDEKARELRADLWVARFLDGVGES